MLSRSIDLIPQNILNLSRTDPYVLRMTHTTYTKPVHQVQQQVLPLRRLSEDSKPFPLDALGPVLGPAAAVIATSVQAPEAICALSLLAAAAMACQGNANVVLDGRCYPLSLFCVSIASSGERKSAVDRLALQPLRAVQDSLLGVYRASMAVRPPSGSTQQAPQPRFPLLVVTEPTVEGLFQRFKDGSPTMGIFSDEAGGFLGGYSCHQERRLHTLACLSKLWDGDAVDRCRKGDPAHLLSGVRLSMHLMGQELLLEKLFHDSLAAGQGFLSRILAVYPMSRMGQRFYRELDPLQAREMQTYLQVIETLARRPFSNGVPEAVTPSDLLLTSEAKSLWIAFHDTIESQLCAGEMWAPIARIAAKAAEQVLRVAGVLALVEDPDVSMISIEQVLRANRLMRWFLEEHLRMQQMVVPDQNLSRAEELLQWLRSRPEDLVWIGDIYRIGPRAFRKAADARTAMQLLQSHGWVERVESRQDKRELWRIRAETEDSGERH
jgi:hypothetical protein